MKYEIYKLQFTSTVHFGRGTLEESAMTFCADSFFSALCQEALKVGGVEGEFGLNALVSLVQAQSILFSDLLPYTEETLWIPKPLYPVKREQDGDSVLKKSFKKLGYIPLEQVSIYGAGNLNPQEMNKRMKKIGSSQVQVRLNHTFPTEEACKTLPYEVGLFRFASGNGLYVIMAYTEEKDRKFFEELLLALSLTGLGGKRSSGCGRFTWTSQKSSLDFGKKAKTYLSLSTCFPRKEELSSALEGANYKVLRRSGFIDSSTYSGTAQKKREFHSFQSGSTFQNAFEGDVFDLSSKSGTHPVYSYQKPLFLGVNL